MVVEIDADDRMAAVIVFDADNIDAAIAELDARYLAGEAAAHARTWSVISGSYAAINRHEMPLTTPDCVNIDRRREIAMGVGDLIAYISAVPDRDQDSKVYVEAVHRLTEPRSSRHLCGIWRPRKRDLTPSGAGSRFLRLTANGRSHRDIRRGGPGRGDREVRPTQPTSAAVWKTPQRVYSSAFTRTLLAVTGRP